MRKTAVPTIGAIIASAFFWVLLAVATGASASPEGTPNPPILDKVPPTWSQILPVEQRFELVMNGAAVLDKETGLVWQQSFPVDLRTWDDALAFCRDSNTGGRMGWHLPTVEQLTSLVDHTSTTARMIPTGAPFEMVWARYPYWTASSGSWYQWMHFAVDFKTGTTLYDNNSAYYHVWCVRGGQAQSGN